jgi:hypothetical protein
MVSFVFLFQYLTPQIILQEQQECDICLELKATAAQVVFGFVWPHILGIGATLMVCFISLSIVMTYFVNEFIIFILSFRLLVKLEQTYLWHTACMK